MFPLKTSENLGFSGLFRGYDLGTVDAAIKSINARRIKWTLVIQTQQYNVFDNKKVHKQTLKWYKKRKINFQT